jgi:hypothetical protein
MPEAVEAAPDWRPVKRRKRSPIFFNSLFKRQQIETCAHSSATKSARIVLFLIMNCSGRAKPAALKCRLATVPAAGSFALNIVQGAGAVELRTTISVGRIVTVDWSAGLMRAMIPLNRDPAHQRFGHRNGLSAGAGRGRPGGIVKADNRNVARHLQTGKRIQRLQRPPRAFHR